MDDAWRAALAAAVRTALADGVQGAPDALAFLGTSRDQLRQLVVEMTERDDGDGDSEVHLAVAEEVERAIRDMMVRMVH